ncbi:Bardet-Biedl syndrome 7 protein [Planoprotostelium fungivorum]|uniref:Bardet-Biedl syndrome 7 protein n=1 Tax=Planoprotostelium fungivorum TaxID=1890364 RepID=A0A2P6NP41_9EUKA|nr:Bardet-Biedl syndrome 7 protein [Planoprotostelium fungivorum]
MSGDEIEFVRSDIHLIGPVSGRSLCLLPPPPGTKATQHVVVGDDGGTLQCLHLKRVDTAVADNKPILRIGLGAPQRNVLKEDIYVSTGNTIHEINRKIDVLIAEPIGCLSVEGGIWVAGTHSIMMYADKKEKYNYLNGDKVHDILADHITDNADPEAIVGCHDGHVRVVRKSTLLFEVETGAPVTALKRYSTKENSKDRTYLYGTASGGLGSVTVDSSQAKKGWTLPPSETLSAVNCISLWNNPTGPDHIVIGRDDGLLDVYAAGDTPLEPPRRISRVNVGESIQAMDVGMALEGEGQEIVLVTHSGKIVVFSGGRPVELIGSKPNTFVSNPLVKEQNDKRIKGLRSELEKLADKVEKAKVKYGKLSKEMVAVVPQYKVNHKFWFDAEGGVWLFSVELPMPLDSVLFQSNVPGLTVSDFDKSASITSTSPQTEENIEDENFYLGSGRILEQVNRAQFKVDTQEGKGGTLQAYVIPLTSPRSCQVVKIDIKPLPLHVRISEKEVENRQFHELSLTGAFSLSEMNAWLSLCLFNVPEILPKDIMDLYFRDSQTKTLLLCKYHDSTSALSIIKDIMTKEASVRGTLLNAVATVSDAAVADCLKMMHPRIERQCQLEKRVKFVVSLQELSTQGEDMSYLSPDNASLLRKADEILSEHKAMPHEMAKLTKMLHDMFIAKQKLRGRDTKSRMEELNRVLSDYSLEALTQLFCS